MKRAFEALASQHRAILFAVVALSAAGLWLGLRLPAAILPEVTFPRITLIAESGERDTEQMLRSVTVPLEQTLRRVPGLVQLRSTTSRGSSELNLDFLWFSDMNLALQRVQGQLDAIRERLPGGTSLDARLMSPALFPVMGLSLSSRVMSPAQLRDYAELQLKPELARLPGVGEVVLQGGRRLEARVTLDPVALQSRGLSVESVAEAVSQRTELQGLGMLSANRELYLALLDARPRDLDQLAQVPIPVANAAPVPLVALGKVELGEAPEFTRYACGSGEAVLVNLLRQPAASTVTLADGVDRWLERHRGELPPGLEIGVFYDQSDLVRASVGSVRDALLVGGLLAIAVMSLFLGSLPLGLIGATVLPASIAITMLGFAIARHSLNLMTLGGVAAAVGLVLDDAIVVVEHLVHESGAGQTRAVAMAELSPVLLASSLCTLAIFIPFGLLGGVAGAFFRVLAVSVALMLTLSLLLCLTLLPGLVGRRLSAARRPLPQLGHATLGRLLPHRRAVLLAVMFVAVAAAILATGIGSGFLPDMDEGTLILDYITPPGTSLDETSRLLGVVEQEIARTPEITAWSRRTGDQLGFFVTEPNRGDYTLRLRRGKRRDADEIADDLRQRIAASAPAVDVEFGQLVEDVIGDLTTNPEPVEIRVFGEDRALARRLAVTAADLLDRVPGVVDVRNGVVVSGPNLLLAPSERAVRMGLGVAALSRGAGAAVGGIPAGQIPRGAREWPIRLVLPRPAEDRVGAVLESRVPLESTGSAILADLTRSQVVPGDVEIARNNQRSVVPITARLSGRDLGSAIAAIRDRFRDSLTVPPTLHLEYAGLYAEQQSSFRGLALVLLLASCCVMLVLLVAFRSWVQALAVLATAIASLAGVMLGLRITGQTFNLSSFVGMIMVVGIVAENACFLVAAHRRFVASGHVPATAAAMAARRRVRPVLMTTLAGLAALLPLALGWGAGAAMLRPLAVAVSGGFALSAALLLVFLPTLLSWSSASDADVTRT